MRRAPDRVDVARVRVASMAAGVDDDFTSLPLAALAEWKAQCGL